MANKTPKKVSVIPANPRYDCTVKLGDKSLRVAAYCRVSTELEQQESSYEAQVEYYTKKIEENPNWRSAGIYADDGKSATNTKKRDDFRAMVQDALNGKIDMIITKSVSRFARNTVDSLTTIRNLKEKNIAVVFEKEGINTLDGTGEILLTILSSLAQEESRNISENIRWGITRKFESGKVIVNCTKFMGYTKNAEEELVIVPEEAEVVKLIFRLFLDGYTPSKIARYLEEQKIKTVNGREKWCDTVITKMLKNEKYMGDALLQKTYTLDFITKKKVENKGFVPQYYVENDHEAIIPKEIFFKVQEEMLRRSSLCKAVQTKKKKQKRQYSAKYALTGIVICGVCGHEYRRVIWAKNGKKKIVWRCTNRLNNGVKNCKESPSIEEGLLNAAIMTAIKKLATENTEFVELFRDNIIKVVGNYQQIDINDEYADIINEKQEEMMKLIAENAKLGTYTESFDQKYKAISDELKVLKEKQQENIRRKKLTEEQNKRVREIDKFLQGRAQITPEFDDVLVRRMVEKVKVESKEKLLIQFKSGVVVEEEM